MVDHKPRAFSINDFRDWDQRKELEITPRWQRRDAWPPQARSYLIDTILKGLPIPKLFIRESINPKTQKTVREVVDGQQRLRAVLDFLKGDLKISKTHNEELAGKTFSNLSDELKQEFLRYEFSVGIIEDAKDSDILDIFARLNSYTMVLNAQEKLNAKFHGAFKTAIYGLAKDTLSFWEDNEILSDRQIVRMTEAELISELVVAMLDGLQEGKKSLRRFYEDYEDEFPDKNRMSIEFNNCLKTIDEIFGNRLKDSEFRRKALFYSLFCVVYDVLYGLGHHKKTTYEIPKKNYSSVYDELVRLTGQIKKRKPAYGYLKFINACSRQTNHIKPRKIRHKYIKDATLPFLTPRH